VDEELQRIKDYADVVRIISHTQIKKLKLRQKKAHILEVQINGGSISDKVDFAKSLLEKVCKQALPPSLSPSLPHVLQSRRNTRTFTSPGIHTYSSPPPSLPPSLPPYQDVTVDSIFSKDENIDTIGASKGHGREGVVTRWGVSRLPRKTHRGLRKVSLPSLPPSFPPALFPSHPYTHLPSLPPSLPPSPFQVACIGAWHPARVSRTVARGGQHGYHHRTEVNKKIYRIGKAGDGKSATTEADLTEKVSTPSLPPSVPPSLHVCVTIVSVP